MNCRICNSDLLELVIDLGKQPWGNNFLKKEEIGKEKKYPLQVVYCHGCKTAQLSHTVEKEVMFGNHTYLSGITDTLNNHFKEIAEYVDKRFFKEKKDKSILDIGSNDGTQLRHYKDLGYEILGIESAKGISKMANDQGINTINEFFNLDSACRLGQKFDLINASGVFFHLEELHSVTEGIKQALKEEGVFVVQFLYMKKIMENLAFDQIYHEHLLYYNLQTIRVLLSLHDLFLFDAYLSPIHGGSIIGFICHKGKRTKSKRLMKMIGEEKICKSNEIEAYQSFAKTIKEIKKKNLSFLNGARDKKKIIYGMGAPVKGNTLLNYFGITSQQIRYLVEKNELRNGLYSPGSHIPIILEKDIKTPPDIYYVLAWNFKKEILEKNKELIKQGTKFYLPVDPK
jgi:SAM-dependent methyltransferase